MKTLARLIPLFTLALFFVFMVAPLGTAHAATSVVGGFDTNGNGFFGIAFGSGPSCFGGSICTVAQTILFLINKVAVPVLFALAFIVFLWGVAKAYIFSGGEADAVSQGHRLILWGIVAFAVMISVWGLVNIVANTFGLYGYTAPPLPQSY